MTIYVSWTHEINMGVTWHINIINSKMYIENRNILSNTWIWHMPNMIQLIWNFCGCNVQGRLNHGSVRNAGSNRNRVVKIRPEPELVWPSSEPNRNRAPAGPVPVCDVQNQNRRFPVQNHFFCGGPGFLGLAWPGRQARRQAQVRPWGKAACPCHVPGLIIIFFLTLSVRTQDLQVSNTKL